MFCRYCGTENPDGALTCVNCDAEIAPAEQPVEEIVDPVYQPVQQPAYQPVAQPVYQPVAQPAQTMAPQKDETVSFGDWFLTIFLMNIPIVNFIMTLVFAFSRKKKKSKSNFFKANLLWMVISCVLSIITTVLIFVFADDFIEEILYELEYFF